MPPKKPGRGGGSHSTKAPRDYHDERDGGPPTGATSPPVASTAGEARISKSTIPAPPIPTWAQPGAVAQPGAAKAQPAPVAPASRPAQKSYVPPPSRGATPSVVQTPAQSIRDPTAIRTTPIPLPSFGPVPTPRATATPRTAAVPISQPSGLSTENAEAQEASAAWAQQTPVLIPGGTRMKKRIADYDLPLNELIPHFFYAPSKANCMKLKNDPPGRLDYDPTSRSFEEVDATPESLSASKKTPADTVAGDRALTQLELYNINKNLKICAFLYGVNWFTMWIVGNAIPEPNTSAFFHKARQYVMTNHQTTKHDFLFDRLVPYTRKWGASLQNSAYINLNMDEEDNRELLLDIVIQQEITSDMFEEVYAHVAVYIDFNKTFIVEDGSDPMEHLPFYSLVTTHHAMFVAAIRVCQGEARRNTGSGMNPGDKRWVQDAQARSDLRTLFDTINLLESLVEFDREDLVEKPIEQSMARTKAKGPNMKVVSDNTVSNMRPPPPKKRRVTTAESSWDASTQAAQTASMGMSISQPVPRIVQASPKPTVTKPTHSRRQTGFASVATQPRSSQAGTSRRREMDAVEEEESVSESDGDLYDLTEDPVLAKAHKAIDKFDRLLAKQQAAEARAAAEDDEFFDEPRPRRQLVPSTAVGAGRAATTTSGPGRGHMQGVPIWLTAAPQHSAHPQRNPMDTRPDFPTDEPAFERTSPQHSQHDGQRDDASPSQDSSAEIASFHRSPEKRPTVLGFNFDPDPAGSNYPDPPQPPQPRITSDQIDPALYPQQFQLIQNIEAQQATQGASGADLGMEPRSIYPPLPDSWAEDRLREEETQETSVAPPKVTQPPRTKRPAATADHTIGPRRSLRHVSNQQIPATRTAMSPGTQKAWSGAGSVNRPTKSSAAKSKPSATKEPSPERHRGGDKALSDRTDLFNVADDDEEHWEDYASESPSVMASSRARHLKHQFASNELIIDRAYSLPSESDSEQADPEQADLVIDQSDEFVIGPIQADSDEVLETVEASESPTEEADEATDSDPQR